MHLSEPFLIAAAVLLAGAVVAAFADRFGAPALLLFLALGMLLGEDGPGGIEFDDAALARDIGTVALAVILLEGGMLAERVELLRVKRPAGLLATLGVLVTGLVVAVAARYSLDLSWSTALIVGAVCSSTDAAAVFSAIRGVSLPPRVAATLEGESGLNDPFAALLVIGLVEWQTTDGYGIGDAVVLLFEQAALGIAGGIAAGAGAVWLLRRTSGLSAGLAPVIALSVGIAGFAGVTWMGGSGLLAAYLIGIIVGDARIPHLGVVRGFLQGMAWLAQIGLFVLLGLLVTPSRIADEGWSPLVEAVALVLIARPLAVLVCTVATRFDWREKVFMAWAGLRGGVPIVFATFPIAAGAAAGLRIFDIVFYVVVASVALQGLTLRPLARRLGLDREERRPSVADLDVATLQSLGADVIELDAALLVPPEGAAIRDLKLPGEATIMAIRRGDGLVPPRGSTHIEPGDRLFLLVDRQRLREVGRLLAASDSD